MRKSIISVVTVVSLLAGFVSTAQAGYNIFSYGNSTSIYGTGSNSGSSVTCYTYASGTYCN